jgi:hypothetical protein
MTEFIAVRLTIATKPTQGTEFLVHSPYHFDFCLEIR